METVQILLSNHFRTISTNYQQDFHPKKSGQRKSLLFIKKHHFRLLQTKLGFIMLFSRLWVAYTSKFKLHAIKHSHSLLLNTTYA